jgi:SAM-dependent methyltransferase
MSARDAYRFINEQDEPTVQSLINRLEFRGKDPAFTQWRDDYLARLRLGSAATVLDLGCGTGVVTRALAGRADFGGRVVGVDQSPMLPGAPTRDEVEGTKLGVGDPSAPPGCLNAGQDKSVRLRRLAGLLVIAPITSLLRPHRAHCAVPPGHCGLDRAPQ